MRKIVLLILSLSFFGCTDILDVKPGSQLDSNLVFEDIDDLEIAVNGAYDRLSSPFYYQGKLLLVGDLMADDFMNPIISSGHLTTIYNYSWNEKNENSGFYSGLYHFIASINDVLERTQKFENEPEYNKLVAELKSLRALHHFNLVKIYGPLYANLGKGDIKSDALGITIKTAVDKEYDIKFTRNTVKEVYEFVVDELEANIDFLPEKADAYLSQDAVRLLLARIYMYMGDVPFKNVDNNYAKALEYVQPLVGDNSNYQLISKVDYFDSWRVDYNSESIFEIPVTEDDNAGNTSLGFYTLPMGGGYKEISATEDFMSLKTEDVRFDLMVEFTEKNKIYHFPTYKFIGADLPYVNNVRVFRLSEAFLIAAECELKLSNNQKAGEYLTELRKNRTDVDPDKYLNSVSLDDILYERRLELYCEGHRAYDLWRNQRSVIRYLDPVEKERKGHSDMSDGTIEFDNYKAIYPISEQEMLFAINRDQQNPNY